jgi:lipopolysaccharide biosynthesis glycosyltransferase
MSEPIRIFIGTSSNGEDAPAEMTYEYSLRKNSSVPIEITWMKQTHDESSPWGGWQTQNWSTPFSGFRWVIPEVCEFKGRAIYTDCDMINFKDINELINVDMQGKPIAARKGSRFGGHEFCVMVFDCEKFEHHSMPMRRMKTIAESHHRMIHKFSGQPIVHDLDPKWNCLDGEWLEIEDIWHLHYTKMETQPWKPGWFTGVTAPHARPEIVQLWYDIKKEAEQNGYKEEDYIPEEKFGSYNIIGR